MLKVTLYRTILILKGLLIHVVLYISLSFINKEYFEYMPIIILHIIFIPMFVGFVILYFNHLYYSYRKVEVRENMLMVNHKYIDVESIMYIEKVMSNIIRPRFPWDSVNIYYYEILLKNGDLIFVTSLMDDRNIFMKWIEKNNISFEADYHFYPFILPTWATR